MTKTDCNEFPFAPEEWSLIEEAAGQVTAASAADDEILCQSATIELRARLDELRLRYGDHPVLIETLADFEDCTDEAVRLYRTALKLAEQQGMPTLTIRIALARILLDEFSDYQEAKNLLIACRHELTSGDPYYVSEWHELVDQCNSNDPIDS